MRVRRHWFRLRIARCRGESAVPACERREGGKWGEVCWDDAGAVSLGVAESARAPPLSSLGSASSLLQPAMELCFLLSSQEPEGCERPCGVGPLFGSLPRAFSTSSMVGLLGARGEQRGAVGSACSVTLARPVLPQTHEAA